MILARNDNLYVCIYSRLLAIVSMCIVKIRDVFRDELGKMRNYSVMILKYLFGIYVWTFAYEGNFG